MTLPMPYRRCRGQCNRLLRPKSRKSIGDGSVVHVGHGYCQVCRDRIRNGPPLPRRNYSGVRRCKAGQDPCPFCENVIWLAENGVSPFDWAARLNTTNTNLARRLYRHHRPGLAVEIERIRLRNRTSRLEMAA